MPLLGATWVILTATVVECKHLRARRVRRALNLHLVTTAALLAGTVCVWGGGYGFDVNSMTLEKQRAMWRTFHVVT